MATPTQIKEKISKLQAILDAGVKTVTVDGVTSTFDFEAIERQIKKYESQLPGRQLKKPFAYKIIGLGE